MKWREKIKTKWRVDSHVNVFKGNPLDHLIFYYLYRSLEWFVIVMGGLLVLYEVLAYLWLEVIVLLVGGSGLVMILRSGAKSEHKAYKDCLKERQQAYEQVKQEDMQALRKQAWLDSANQGKTELEQKLNHKE